MIKKEYHVEISDATLSMLDAHVDFLAQVSKKAALKVMNTILDGIASLSENPERFPIYENKFVVGVVYHKMLIERRYLVLYEIATSDVFVDYILDCRQDNDKKFITQQ